MHSAAAQVDGIELGCTSCFETALHAAARNNHIDVVELLTEADPTLVDLADVRDCAALTVTLLITMECSKLKCMDER